MAETLACPSSAAQTRLQATAMHKITQKIRREFFDILAIKSENVDFK
jgi:hypothetical protein